MVKEIVIVINVIFVLFVVYEKLYFVHSVILFAQPGHKHCPSPRGVLVSVNFGCFSPSRFSHFHCNAMRKAIKAHKNLHTNQQNDHTPGNINSESNLKSRAYLSLSSCVFVSVNFGCFSPSRFLRFHCNAMRKATCEYQRHPYVNWKNSNVARLSLI